MRKSDGKALAPDFKRHVNEVIENLRTSLYELHDAATRDEKTGVYNHQFFKTVFGMETEKAKEGKEKLCLAMIDIDFFKKFNDTYGHLVGDEILIELTKNLAMHLRKYDILARFGGEEFLVLLPETTAHRARQIAERLRKGLWKNDKLKKYKVTISIGVTEYKARDNMERMIKRADKALYISKENGRNRVTIL
ncbi:MAG: GGDEF domain-containing protein [Nanoarchaeota archaeon]|nr:GGDEF domain-containing protein [Nanoarchaeota archaeon]